MFFLIDAHILRLQELKAMIDEHVEKQLKNMVQYTAKWNGPNWSGRAMNFLGVDEIMEED